MDATPALITLVTIHEKFGSRPDIVVSGINRGANIGRAILHSGTVGAAFTAYQYGCRALAVSLDVIEPSTQSIHWDTAGEVAARVFNWMCRESQPGVVNCNVPNVQADGLGGIRRGSLDLLGTFQTSITEQTGGSLPTTFAESDTVQNQTDNALIRQGFVSVTALLPVVEDTEVDLEPLLSDEWRGPPHP